MKYSLDLDESLEDEVRRIASARLTEAAGLLRDQPDGMDEAIHDARRHIKQCRALYRLVRSAAKSFQKAENGRLGDIGRQLSAMRDAKALIEATHYLKQQIPSKSNGMLMDRLAKRLEQRRKAVTNDSANAAAVVAAAERDLCAAADAVSKLSLPNGARKSAACLADGWETVGARARAAIEASAEDGDEPFHDMRKRTQDRWMHAALLRDLWPTAMLAIQRQGKALSDLLGHAQDLAVLREAVSGTGDLVNDTVESEAVREAILSQQTKLRDEYRQLAGTLFDNAKPSDGDMITRLLLGR